MIGDRSYITNKPERAREPKVTIVPQLFRRDRGTGTGQSRLVARRQHAGVLGDGELVRVDDVAVEGLVDGRHDLHEVLVHGRTSTGI